MSATCSRRCSRCRGWARGLRLAMLAVHAPHSLVSRHRGGRRARRSSACLASAPRLRRRLLLELGGKLTLPEGADAPAAVADAREQVVDALVALGWQAKAATAAVDEGRPGADRRRKTCRRRCARRCSRWEARVADDSSRGSGADGVALTGVDADALERSAEAALRPRSLDEFVGQQSGAGSTCAGAAGGQPARRQRGAHPAVGTARAGQDHARDDRGGGVGRVPAAHLRPRDPARGGPGGDPAARSRRATCCSWTRSTAWPAPSRRCSTSRWRTSASTWWWARAPVPRRSR